MRPASQLESNATVKATPKYVGYRGSANLRGGKRANVQTEGRNSRTQGVAWLALHLFRRHTVTGVPAFHFYSGEENTK